MDVGLEMQRDASDLFVESFSISSVSVEGYMFRAVNAFSLLRPSDDSVQVRVISSYLTDPDSIPFGDFRAYFPARDKDGLTGEIEVHIYQAGDWKLRSMDFSYHKSSSFVYEASVVSYLRDEKSDPVFGDLLDGVYGFGEILVNFDNHSTKVCDLI